MNANELADEWQNKVDMWEGKHYENWCDEAATMLRQQQAEIEVLKKQCFAFQNASIDLVKKNAFLEDWKKTWSPYIKEAHGINTTILKKAQE